MFRKAFLGFGLAMVLASSSFATAGSNCRLIIHIHFKDGKKKVNVEETGALSHEECRITAQQRQLDSEGEDVKRVKVVFGYRELSVLGDAEAEAEDSVF